MVLLRISSSIAASRARAAASGELSDFYTSKLLAGAQVVDAHDGRPYVRAQAARERLRGAFEDAVDNDAELVALVGEILGDAANAEDIERYVSWV